VLPYHPTGVDKHRRLGGEAPDVEFQLPNEDDIDAVVDRLRAHGLEVHNGGAK
jgi:hypothetical protein